MQIPDATIIHAHTTLQMNDDVLTEIIDAVQTWTHSSLACQQRVE